MFRALVVLLMTSPLVLAGPANAARLKDLGWLSGHWTAMGESHVDEIWTDPQAGSMTGMFRLVNKKKLSVLEYIVMSEEKGGVFYRFKHFNADYGTWEGNKAPLTFKLKEFAKGRAVFKNVNEAKNQPAYISYLLGKDGTLKILVGSAPQKADKSENIEFVLTRQ